MTEDRIKNISNTVQYFDSASTTKIDDRVLSAMMPYFTELYGNASSNHLFGKKARNAVEKSRNQIAEILNCESKEIIFTSGSTESINLAIKGYVESNYQKGNHIITVKTEHKAVLATCKYLETKGFEVTYLDVDENGLISLDDLQRAISDKTVLIAVMYANNETGVIQPIKEIGKIAHENEIVFFCDATQAVGKVKIDVTEDYIDMLCLSGHKINGPKGIGALYFKEGIELTPLIHGGGQEKGLRGGTYNTPLIVGIGKACELAKEELKKNKDKLLKERSKIIEHYETNKIGKVNFRTVECVPHIISITLNDFEAEEYLMLKHREFVASTGSACNAEIIDPSHVLNAMEIDFKEKIFRLSIEI